jgi:hypothetical protein
MSVVVDNMTQTKFDFHIEQLRQKLHSVNNSAEVKERGELSLFSLCAFMACSRLNFTFLIMEATLTD